MKRSITGMIKTVHKINEHTITSYTIRWTNKPDAKQFVTRVYERLGNQGLGVICYCDAHKYRKTCYHIRDARLFVSKALSQKDNKQ